MSAFCSASDLISSFSSYMFMSTIKRHCHSDSEILHQITERMAHRKNARDKLGKVGVLQGVLLQEFLRGVEPSKHPELRCHCLHRAGEGLLQGVKASTPGLWYSTLEMDPT